MTLNQASLFKAKETAGVFRFVIKAAAAEIRDDMMKNLLTDEEDNEDPN